MTANLMVVNDQAVSSGSIVFWRHGGVVNHEKLKQAWLAAGFAENALPPRQGDLIVLRRAMASLENDDTILRPVERGEDSTAQGVAVLTKQTVNGKAVFTTRWEVLLQADGSLSFQAVGDHDLDQDLNEMVRMKFEREQRVLPHGVISHWLVGLVLSCTAVSLRDSGGIYFVPKVQMPMWHAYMKVVRSVSHLKAFEIPAVSCTEATEAVLDALAQEAATLTEKVDKEYQTLGARALATREASLTAYTNKLDAYAGIIGGSLDVVKQRVEDLKGRVSTAMLASMDI